MPVNVTPGSAGYPRNHWYVAAFSHEVKTGELLKRTLCDEPVVLYRLSDGSPVALFDRCPHRGLPLSMGRLLPNDRLQCLYHGFEFASSGQCTLVPSQDVPPKAIRVRAYPVVEKWKWIWFWPGDPEKADPALIPDHVASGLEAEGWVSVVGTMLPVQANYLLASENLADATHISYLHHGLIDDSKAAKYPFELIQEDGSVALVREIRSERQGEVICKSFGWEQGIVLDRTLRLENRPPQTCIVANTWRAAEGGPAFAPFSNKLIVMLTPASVRSTLQFVALTFKGAAPPPVPREVQEAQLRYLLSEDVVAIEAIQKLIDDLPPEQSVEMSVRADEGGIRTRRLIAAMLEREQRASVSS
jgi:vanillate O-demethylase monooxygenase subunit